MKILITGGSGFLGINLARYMCSKNYEVHILDVVDFEYEDIRSRIKFYKNDIRDLDSLTKICNGIDVIVHTAAALPLYSNRDIYTTDINGTKNVLEAARLTGVDRVIQISSTAVYGIPSKHPIYEDDKLSGVGPYGRSKIIAERICLEYRKKGLCVPILRPKSFIGPERLGVFAIYYDWILSGKNIPIVGWGENRYQLLDVEDLCEAIQICIVKESSIVNDTFNIGSKEFGTMKEDFGHLIDVAKTGKRVVPLPPSLTIWALRCLELLGISPLYKWVYETAPKDSFVSIEKAEEKLGFFPKYSNKQSLERNFEWYIENLEKFKLQSGTTHRVPWKQGVLSIIKSVF